MSGPQTCDFRPNHFVPLVTTNIDDGEIVIEDALVTKRRPARRKMNVEFDLSCDLLNSSSDRDDELPSDSNSDTNFEIPSNPVNLSTDSDTDLEIQSDVENSISDIESDKCDIKQLSDIPTNEETLVNDLSTLKDTNRNNANGVLTKFLGINQVLEILSAMTNVKEKVPFGPKENVYYIVDNKSNVERRQNAAKSEFWDDCGIWESSSGATPLHTSCFVMTNLVRLLKKEVYSAKKKC